MSGVSSPDPLIIVFWMVLFSATFKKAAESFSAFSDNLRWLSAKDEIKPYHDRYLTPSTNQRTFVADRATWTGMLLWPEAREKRVLRVVCQGVRHFPGCLVCVGSSCGGCSAPIQPSYSLPRHRMCRSGVYDCELIAIPCQALLQRLASAVFYHGALCFFSVARCSDILLPTPWANLIQARYWEQDANVPPDAKKISVCQVPMLTVPTIGAHWHTRQPDMKHGVRVRVGEPYS